MQREFQGQSYRWSGKVWLDQHFLEVPQKLADDLNEHFLTDLLDPDRSDWMDLAVTLRRAGTDLQNRSTLGLVARACRMRLNHNPRDQATRAILSSALRHLGQPLQAEEVTRNWTDPAVLTSRAAALCDLGRWNEAQAAVKLALRCGAGEYAKQVQYRILAQEKPSGRSA